VFRWLFKLPLLPSYTGYQCSGGYSSYLCYLATLVTSVPVVILVAPVTVEPCALGSTQPLKMSTRKTSHGKGGRCVRVTTLPPS
jgi:hypothetical protein